jgi:Fatty acid desaturase
MTVPSRALQRSRSDAVLVGLSILHGALLLVLPNPLLIAVALWWNANTVSHYFVHRPFFRHRSANAIFAAYLSMLLGFPHALWRARHLAHHAGVPPRVHPSCELIAQLALIVMLWALMAAQAPLFFAFVYLPGYAAGLLLCVVHGYYEHAAGTTNYYGALYNVLLFNDGYHVEHHASPSAHWATLSDHRRTDAPASAWPAPLRWMEALNLQTLERIVLMSPALQRFVLRAHAKALGPLVAAVPQLGRIAIVGGGLFPRTALILRRLLPNAHITIIDANCANLECARPFFPVGDVELLHGRYPDAALDAYDAIVFPLAFDGDRAAVYARPPAPIVLAHDWVWRRSGAGRIVSLLLLKRINLVRR